MIPGFPGKSPAGSGPDLPCLWNIYSSAFLKKDGSLVMVITNGGKSRKINLKGLNYETMTIYTTTADEDWSIKTEPFKDSISLPASSIITIVLK